MAYYARKTTFEHLAEAKIKESNRIRHCCHCQHSIEKGDKYIGLTEALQYHYTNPDKKECFRLAMLQLIKTRKKIHTDDEEIEQAIHRAIKRIYEEPHAKNN